MKCPKCVVELEPGMAIVPFGKPEVNAYQYGIAAGYYPTELAYDQLYQVMKCPKCGYSETMEQQLQKVNVDAKVDKIIFTHHTITLKATWGDPLPNESELAFFDQEGNELARVFYYFRSDSGYTFEKVT